MTRQERYLTAKQKAGSLPFPEPVRFTAETWRRHEEEMKRLSENRLMQIYDSDVPTTINNAVTAFIRKRKLTVRVTEDPDDLPKLSAVTRFKYSGSSEGDLPEIQGRMKTGEDAAVAWVKEDGLVIGYGLAFLTKAYTDITIIDVDLYSRRSHGLAHEFKIKDERFSVGIGHAVVRALLKHCPPPFRTDATNPNSRYIFKSFGFRERPKQGNPCLLEFAG